MGQRIRRGGDGLCLPRRAATWFDGRIEPPRQRVRRACDEETTLIVCAGAPLMHPVSHGVAARLLRWGRG